MNFRATRILAAALLASSCGFAFGLTKTAQFNVTATVLGNCFITAGVPMAFVGYVPGTGNVDLTTTINVRCTTGTAYGIDLDAGNATGSTIAARVMKSSTATTSTLNYSLSTDTGRTTNWISPGTAGAAAGNQGGVGTGLGNTLPHTVYGRLLDDAISQAAAPAANYTTTVTATINY